MVDEPENLALVYLRRLDEKVDALRTNMTDMTHRFASIEKLVAGLRDARTLYVWSTELTGPMVVSIASNGALG